MFGGPIKKNKLFFFADWERTMRRQAASAFRTVPTAALRKRRLQRYRHHDLRSAYRQRRRHRAHAVSRQHDPIEPHRSGRGVHGGSDSGAQPAASSRTTTSRSAATRSPATTSMPRSTTIPTEQAADFRALQHFSHAGLRSALAGRGGRRCDERRPAGDRARADPEHRHRRNLHRVAARAAGWRVRLHAAASVGAERGHRQELRPGRAEDSGHQRHRSAAGRLPAIHVQYVFEPRQSERLEPVPVPRQPVRHQLAT